LLFGLLPWESTALAWTAVALVGVIGVFGPPLQWPSWMMDISPFTQIPKLPGGTLSAEPLIWLCAIALTISTVGLVGLRRRDLGDLGPSRPVNAIRDRIVAYARESIEPSQQAAEHDTAQPPEVTDRVGSLPPDRQPQGDQAGLAMPSGARHRSEAAPRNQNRRTRQVRPRHATTGNPSAKPAAHSDEEITSALIAREC
jgi:hypothetical protein